MARRSRTTDRRLAPPRAVRPAALPWAAALERMATAAALVDAAGDVRWANAALREGLLGLAPGAPCPQVPWRTLFAPRLAEPAAADRLEAALRHAQAEPFGPATVAAISFLPASPRPEPCEPWAREVIVSIAPLETQRETSPGTAPTDRAPAPGWTVWTFADVTRQRRTEESFHTLLRHSADGILLLDRRRRLCLFNDACERITGYPAEAVLHRPGAADALFREPPPEVPPAGSLTRETLLRTRSGEERWVEITYAPVRDERGEASYLLGIVRDVSRRHALEEQLRLTRKLATLGELASALAHEIKNPLGVILSASEILIRPDRPEQHKRQAAQFIHDEAKRLDERLTTFLRFARPRPPAFQVQNIHRVLTQTIIAYQTMAREGLELRTHFAPSLPRVRIDADQMQQVFLNLLLNADQAMPSGGTIAISTGSGPDGTTVRIAIADTGVGLPDVPVGRLFEPFFSTKPRGTGLGLATVLQIVTAHGGTIEAANRPEGGASFVVSLPAASDEDDRQAPDEP